MPSRLRRLDGALADLPLEDPMLLSELDGFLTGVLLSPEPVLPAEWMQTIWGSDASGVAPFDDPLDVQWFADAVTARYNEIARDLARGKPQPIHEIDERNGDVLWEVWVDGFAQAMDLRPDAWTVDGDPDLADAMSRMSMLIAIANQESELDSVEINAFQDRATAEIEDVVRRLHALRGPVEGAPASTPQAKPGRNDPCPCGSGRKFKRCCGAG